MKNSLKKKLTKATISNTAIKAENKQNKRKERRDILFGSLHRVPPLTPIKTLTTAPAQ